MKSLFSYSLLAAIVASGMAFGQTTATTTPVGYTTQVLAANTFHLVGLSLHPSPVAAGQISSLNANSVTHTPSAFGTLLTAGSTYILEITSGTGKGVIQEVTSWNGSSLNVAENLAVESGVLAGDSFKLRKAPTLEDVFGTTESSLTKGFNSGGADVVWIPSGTGAYAQYFLHNTNQWRNAATNVATSPPSFLTF